MCDRKYNTAVMTMDGNMACCLVGIYKEGGDNNMHNTNLQEGEAEFVDPKDCPDIYKDDPHKAERWALTQSHKRLCARLGVQLGYYTGDCILGA